MNPMVAAKRYGRTAVCVINGAFNTDWEAIAHTMDKDALHKVTGDTNFPKSHVEDSLAFTFRDFSDNYMFVGHRQNASGRPGDNKPNIPVNSLLNGIPGRTAQDVQDRIHVVGTHLGEGAIQAGGSGRTYNTQCQTFAPGTVLAGIVLKKDSEDGTIIHDDAANVHLAPMAMEPRNSKFPLLDRGRTLSALKQIGPSVFPLDDGDPSDPMTDTAREVARYLLNQIAITQATEAMVTGEAKLKQVKNFFRRVQKYFDAPGTVFERKENDTDLIALVHLHFESWTDAYSKEISGATSLYGRAIIEPLEQGVLDMIEKKNNVTRSVFGITVAPCTSDSPMIAFNYINYSR